MKLLENLYPRSEPSQQYGEGFTCHVNTFTDGWVEIQKKTKLFFEYKDNFACFLEQLQDTTRQCLIPPKIFQPVAEGECATSYVQQDCGFASYTANQNGTEIYVFRQRGPNESGYTLLDGPWTYRICEPQFRDGASKLHYYPAKDLGNEAQFELMMAELRQCEKEIKVSQQSDWDGRDAAIRRLKEEAVASDQVSPRVAETIRQYKELPMWNKRSAHVIITHVSSQFPFGYQIHSSLQSPSASTFSQSRAHLLTRSVY